jgi:membrane protein implicated in regulation of membrane protease activity
MVDPLNCFYLVLVGIGVLYGVIIMITGGIHDLGGAVHLPFDIGAHEAPALGHGDTSVPSLSPVTIASFVTAFGAFGIFATQGFGTSAATSVFVASIGGLIMAAIAHFAFGYFLIAPQGSSEVTQHDIIGATAEVTAPIPVNGTGEVAFVAQGGRVSYPARSLDRVPLPRGTTVTIVEMVGSVVAVRARTSFK